MAREYQIREMTVQDISAGMHLKNLAGWNQTEEDWQLLLKLGSHGCFVAVCDTQIVGTVTAISYGNQISWIGMLLVDPAYRRVGIGTSLLQRALAAQRERGQVKLDATPAGEALYARLGFQREWGLLRMAVDSLPPVRCSPTEMRRAAPDALDAVLALDRGAFGGDRACLLRALAARDPDLAWQQARQGRATGYCLGRRGSHFVQIGPLVAESAEDAVLLCQVAVHGLAGQAVALDVPAEQGAFLSWLRSLGFAEQRPFVRMVWQARAGLVGPDSNTWCHDAPDRPVTDHQCPTGALGSGPPDDSAVERLFAIAGPEFG